MKNLLKDKKVIVGLVLVAGALAYYMYDKKRKEQIKAEAEKLASTPAVGASTTVPAHTPAPKHGANYKPLDTTANQPAKAEL